MAEILIRLMDAGDGVRVDIHPNPTDRRSLPKTEAVALALEIEDFLASKGLKNTLSTEKPLKLVRD